MRKMKGNFLEFLQELPVKTSTCLRIFEHEDSYSLHGSDAVLVGEKVLKNQEECTTLEKGDIKIKTIHIKKNKLEMMIKKILFVLHYKLEIYKCDNNEWKICAKASPGNVTEIEDELLNGCKIDDEFSNAVAAIKLVVKDGQTTVNIGIIDYSSSQVLYSTFEDSPHFTNLESIFVQIPPKECVYCKTLDSVSTEKLLKVLKRNGICANETKGKLFNTRNVEQSVNGLLIKKTRNKSNKVVLTTSNAGAMSCLNALITKLKILDRAENLDQFQIKEYKLSNYMRLDRHAVSALNLFSENKQQNKKQSSFNSLFSLLNHCSTVQGEKQLERWIKQPLIDVEKINERLKLVDGLMQAAQVRQFLADNILKKLPDLEKLSKKFHKKTATLKDCYQLYQAIRLLPSICNIFEENVEEFDEEKWKIIVENFKVPLQETSKDFKKYQSMIETTMDFKSINKHEYLIRPDFDPELQEIKGKIQDIEVEMESLADSVTETLNFDSSKPIKLELTPQNGYTYRILCKDAKLLNKHPRFTKLETVKNGVRFQDKDLKNASFELLALKSDYQKQQESIVSEIINIVSGYYQPIIHLNQLLSKLDVLISFAKTAATSPSSYVMPILYPMSSSSDLRMKLKQSRHPCVERQDQVSFIPNDVEIRKNDHNFVIVTGPNMGGKSTFIRQVGVIVLMAQIGSFVPCEEAHITIVDAVLARMGAGDSQMQGVSTFLSEMMETSTILESSTEHSLVIIDELGRGTSTFDGFGLAWSISRHISTVIKSPCLFATHYHEMTYLADEVKPVVNYHMKAYTDEDTGNVIMLHQIGNGACDQSFGINVAQSVGFPKEVIDSAKSKALMLEDFQIESNYKEKEDRERLIDEFLSKVTTTDWSSMEKDERKRIMKSFQAKVMW